MKILSILVTLAALTQVPAFAAQKNISLSCGPDTEGGFDVNVDLEKGEIFISDGAELSATYKADSALDTAGYAVFKIKRGVQDGEQPNEVKIAKALLTGEATHGGAWLSAGIVGGAYQCKVTQ